tara:strand:- start:77 stop:3589 length:3513 start_codon:yes stop_codon:yes gene_type:complete
MNARLVAYRKATSSATVESTYELDLQEEPNISLNFQFSDIKEPETRKGSYSQTFKLPFTENNNEFFQNWYEVNLETLVFNTKTKFQAILYAGSVSQFEGNLQLKAVYKKAQYYEIVLMSNSATLFSLIGEKRLKDVFKESDGGYSAELNHLYSESNVKNSFDGSTSSFTNIAGDSLRDASAGVQKVMYPMSLTQPNFYYDSTDFNGEGAAQKRFLRLDSSAISSMSYDEAEQVSVSVTQFRPAVQLRTLLKLIIAKAGFSYTSNFIDSSYFGRIFTTTGGHLESDEVPSLNSDEAPTGFMYVASAVTWGNVSFNTINENMTFDRVVYVDTTSPIGSFTIPQDNDSVFTSSGQYFTKKSNSMSSLDVSFIATGSEYVQGTLTNAGATISTMVVPYDINSGASYGSPYSIQSGNYGIGSALGYDFQAIVNHTLDLDDVPEDGHFQVIARVTNVKATATGQTFTFGKLPAGFFLGTTDEYDPVSGNLDLDLYSKISINWYGSGTGLFNKEVDVPSCIDPAITQKAFLKDLVQRFNLVILTNPDDETNLIIEPYKDYIEGGEIKYWSDKLDTSKEVIVKDTSDIQKKTILFSDQEDVDILNKEIKEQEPTLNVFGKVNITETGNDFATGELKNESIFSPFINSQVYASSDTQGGTFIPNLTVQYEFSYEEREGIITNPIKATKPKLYYYGGTPSDLRNSEGADITVNMHYVSVSVGVPSLVAIAFDKLPNCSPFDITPSTDGITNLDTDNKSLYWNSTPPLVGNLSMFNYSEQIGSWFSNTLYGLYWRPYLNDIYNDNARIMECYLNLSQVDIFQFKFNDEVFIKDTYWRILKIENYQVLGNTSTKVVLIKSLNTLSNNLNCNYVLGFLNGSNLYGGNQYLWCPEGTPGCTPSITGDMLGIYAEPECCIGNGGIVQWQDTSQAANGLYPCQANASSLPMYIKNIYSSINIFEKGGLKALLYNKIGGNKPIVIGNDYNKYSHSILPTQSNDIVIKHKTSRFGVPILRGESHRFVLSGNTDGTTRGYAYFEGNETLKPIVLPTNSNTIIRVKGTATVIGGTSTVETVGSTEAFSYYTAFSNLDGTITQLGTAGGVSEFSLHPHTTTSTLHIDTTTEGVLRFGLDDSRTDTKRLWSLTVDLDINLIENLYLPYGENWALFQNFRIIELENGDYLIWN